MTRSQPLDLNILPEKYRPRKIATPLMIGVATMTVLLLGLIPAYVVLSSAQTKTTQLEARLTEAQAALQTEADSGQLEEIEEQIAQTKAQITQVRESFGALGTDRTPRAICLSAVVATRASGVHISSLTQDENVCTVSGRVEREELALHYARALRSTNQFANVLIVSLDEVSPKTSEVDFTISLEQGKTSP